MIIGKRKKRRGWIKPLAVICISVFLLYLYYICLIAPVIHDVAREKARIAIANAMNEASAEVLINASYDDFVTLHQNTDGDVTLLQINTIYADVLARKTSLQIQKRLSEMELSGVDIPLGTLSGIAFLSGLGPPLTLQVMTLGAPQGEFVSSFQSAGINQTIHRLSIVFTLNASIVLPSYSSEVSYEMETIIAESIIVGKIPTIYLGGSY